MRLSEFIYILIVFVLLMLFPVPWYIGLAIVLALYFFASSWCIEKIDDIIWKLRK